MSFDWFALPAMHFKAWIFPTPIFRHTFVRVTNGSALVTLLPQNPYESKESTYVSVRPIYSKGVTLDSGRVTCWTRLQ